MTLERYNQIAIAVLSSVTLVALVIIGVVIGFMSLAKHDTQGIVIDRGHRPTPKQNMVLCLPARVPGSEYEYFAIGAVVERDQSETPVLGATAQLAYSPVDSGCRLDSFNSFGRIFNVVVRNTNTRTERLIFREPALVYALRVPSEKCKDGEGDVPCGTLLWVIRQSDSNNDGIIDHKDASVGYISDLSASKLSQVTPTNATLLAHLWIPERRRLMFQIRRDANGDRQFTNEDGSDLIEVDVDRPSMGVPALSTDTVKGLSSAFR